jgi:O-antigen/teichoic acid export membrane protein
VSEEIEQNTKETTTAYRNIFKATSLFGGVQIYQILIGVIKSKFIAVLLGPTGMGIQGLYTSATSLIQGLTSMGLSQSAVKNVAEANGTGDKNKVNLIVTVLRRLVWITGLLGMIVTIAFSPLLSKSSFGNYNYTIPFIILSVILLLNQLSAGQQVVLQGMRQLKYLAKSTAIGATIGLLVSVPIYYFYGVKGIVPTIILASITTLILTWYFSKKIKIEKVEVTTKQTFQEGKEMLKMGIAMSISGILVLGSSYIIRSFISYKGGVEEVGLFTAGFAIVNTYVGMIFTAMGTDYYPRLAAVNKDNNKCREIVNQQSEIAVLIMAPLILAFLIFMPFIVKILYSNQFLLANGYMQWAIMGMLFKVASWAIAFQFIAKGESKLFIINETLSNVYILIFNILGYSLLGLDGLGISFMIGYLIYLIQVYLIARKRYNFSFTRAFNKIYISQLILLVICFLFIIMIKIILLKYCLACILLLISSYFAFKGLDKRIGIKSIIRNSVKK